MWGSSENQNTSKSTDVCEVLEHPTADPTLAERRRRKGRTRRLSAYYFFAADERHNVRAENPHFKHIEVMQETGRRWSNAGIEIKSKYLAIAMDNAKVWKSIRRPETPDKSKVQVPNVSIPKILDNQKIAYPPRSSKLDKLLGVRKNTPNPLSNVSVTGRLKLTYPTLKKKSRCTEDSSSVKITAKTPKDPNEPKRSPGAFMMFSTHQRPKILTLSPYMNSVDLARELNRRWKNLDPNLQIQYKLLAKKKFDIYMQELEIYYRNGTRDNQPNQDVQEPAVTPPVPSTAVVIGQKSMPPGVNPDEMDQ